MTIEAGKQYLTRSGKIARIYATDGGGRQPVHGAVQIDDEWNNNTWTDNGTFMNEPGKKFCWDLVREVGTVPCEHCGGKGFVIGGGGSGTSDLDTGDDARDRGPEMHPAYERSGAF